ncbi:hypothetical protein [Amycolatopsis sp. NPDC052450]|uniref:hypothetical protein n=1 Tax=Amycolatopsis sp. NPDC052450 TaxID=3363937 RepID=UPI0037C7B2B9
MTTQQQESERTRTEAAVAWTVGHAGELAGITLPAIGAALVWPWLATVSGVVAVWWALNEVRDHKTRVELQNKVLPRQIETGSQGNAGIAGEREVRA